MSTESDREHKERNWKRRRDRVAWLSIPLVFLIAAPIALFVIWLISYVFIPWP